MSRAPPAPIRWSPGLKPPPPRPIRFDVLKTCPLFLGRPLPAARRFFHLRLGRRCPGQRLGLFARACLLGRWLACARAGAGSLPARARFLTGRAAFEMRGRRVARSRLFGARPTLPGRSGRSGSSSLRVLGPFCRGRRCGHFGAVWPSRRGIRQNPGGRFLDAVNHRAGRFADALSSACDQFLHPLTLTPVVTLEERHNGT